MRRQIFLINLFAFISATPLTFKENDQNLTGYSSVTFDEYTVPNNNNNNEELDMFLAKIVILTFALIVLLCVGSFLRCFFLTCCHVDFFPKIDIDDKGAHISSGNGESPSNNEVENGDGRVQDGNVGNGGPCKQHVHHHTHTHTYLEPCNKSSYGSFQHCENGH